MFTVQNRTPLSHRRLWKPRVILPFWTLLAVFAAGTVPAIPAQAQYGDRYLNLYTGNTWNNPISSYLDTVMAKQRQQQMLDNQMFNNMLFSKILSDNMLRQAGNRRITAGQASTRFSPSARGSQVETMVPRDVSAQEKQRAAAANRACLSDFHAAMKRFGLQPYDVADARALAFTMGFTAMNGKDPGPARLKNIRSQFRSVMMKDPMFQVLPDYERQARYEKMVIPAMLAVTARRHSTRPELSAAKKGMLVATAEHMGAGILQGLWTEPVEAIELSPTGFVDRGRRLVATGAGQSAFRRSGESVAVREAGGSYLNQSFGWDEKYQRALLDRFDATVTKMGLSTQDLADVNVAAAAVVYPVFSSGKTTLGPAQIAWLRKEMRKDIMGSPDFQRMSDAKKQEQYERLALRAMHIRAQDEKMRGDIVRFSQKTSDPFTNMGNAGIADSNKKLLETNRNSAHTLLKEIFSPRAFDDYRVTGEGFTKR